MQYTVEQESFPAVLSIDQKLDQKARRTRPSVIMANMNRDKDVTMQEPSVMMQLIRAKVAADNKEPFPAMRSLTEHKANDGQHLFPMRRARNADIPRNVQAAASTAADKKPQKLLPVIDVNGAANKAHVRETKRKSEVAFDNSPDKIEAKLKKRKISHTDKPIEPVIYDIDAFDVNNQLAVVDYIEDLYRFYKISEQSCRPHDYMHSQVEINVMMRAILADWLIEVHSRFQLLPESLYLTFSIIDRYLSAKKVLRRELKLVGISALLIACKYEEMHAPVVWAPVVGTPKVNDLVWISNRAYSREQILGMEKDILNVLGWSVTVPTLYVFLTRFIKAGMCDKTMENMVFFFAELSLTQYALVMYPPSLVAAAAVYAARCTLKKKPLWTETLSFYTGFKNTQLLDCAEILVRCHAEMVQDKLKFLHKKYSSFQFNCVALNHPATWLLEELKAAAGGVEGCFFN